MRFRRLWVALGAGGVALVVPLLLAGPAAAQSQPCDATVNGTSIGAYDVPGKALRVGRDAVVTVAGTVARSGERPDELVHHMVRLEFAGVQWTVDDGTENGSRWSGRAAIKDYAKHGEGLYKVVASAVSTNGSICYETAYVRVGNSNPVDTTAGVAAAGATLVGVGAAAAAGSRQFGSVEQEMDAFDRKLAEADGGPKEPSDAEVSHGDHNAEASARWYMQEELARLRERRGIEKLVGCCTLAVAGVGLTVLAMAHEATRTVVAVIGRLPR